jgi:hypothetical protein
MMGDAYTQHVGRQEMHTKTSFENFKYGDKFGGRMHSWENDIKNDLKNRV